MMKPVSTWHTIALLAIGLAGTPAWAQDRPVTTPTRDVDVTYRIAGPQGAAQQRMRWSKAEQKLRVDPPATGVYLIADYRTHKVAMVQDTQRRVLDIDAQGKPMPGEAASTAAYVRAGESKVAGLPCTEWTTKDNSGADTLTCFTSDGVLLRASRGDQVLIEAGRVSYDPQDSAEFRVPDDYLHMTPAPAAER